MPDNLPLAGGTVEDLIRLAGSGERFGAIAVDPAWHYKTYNEAGRNRCPDWKPFKGSPSRHYETMSIEEIAALPVEPLAAENCCLFLWVTWPLLFESKQVIDQWGFTYKTCAFCWLKAHAGQLDMFRDDYDVSIGCGHWTRANSEACLLATRGNPKRLNADVRQGIIEPRREHSRKPDCVHGRIERLVSGPYLELFARRPREGWTCWGDELPPPDSGESWDAMWARPFDYSRLNGAGR
jgi:N6-adenosine-specific RNA methylase IME4